MEKNDEHVVLKKEHVKKLDFKMKFCFLMASCMLFQLSANSVMSQKKMEFNYDNVPLKRILNEITSQTGYRFFYNVKEIDAEQKVSIKVDGENVREVLNKLAMEASFNFRINENQIVLTRKITTFHKFQERGIKGTVTDGNGTPLPGANIIEKGTTNGVTADFDGNFSLDLVDENATLVVSYIGFATKEVGVNGQSNITINLEESAAGLDEVVVVGYGTVKKSDLTGSVSSVSSEEITEVQTVSVENALQGRAAGVDVTQTSGQPGGVNRVRIRGGNSLSAGNEPLYVIDGFPIYNDNSATNTSASRGPTLNALSTLNPGDIESIEILKDASATAIYGSRGANGVILITTKRGKVGDDQITLDVSSGLQSVINTVDMLDATEWAKLENEIFTYQRDILGNTNAVPVYTDAQIASFGEGTNWQDIIFRNAAFNNYQLTFSGGDEKFRYSVIGSYTNQDGIILGSDLERGSIRFNLDRTINSRLKIGTSNTVTRTKANLAYTGGAGAFQGSEAAITSVALGFNPINSVRDENGEYIFQDVHLGEFPGANNRSVPFYNPVALADLSTNESISYRFLTNTFLEYELFKGLKLKTSIGGDYISTTQNSYFPSTVRISAGINGDARKANVQDFTWLNENTLNYNRFDDNNNLDLLAGVTFQGSTNSGFSVRDRGFANDILEENNIGSGSDTPPLSSPSEREWGLVSYLGRINYVRESKYLFTLTARADGSSRFGQDNKWGFFPSGAIGWNVSQERFLEDSKLISNLKVRASYGLTGNQEIPVYQSLSGLSGSSYVFDDQLINGFVPNRLANPELKWETTTQLDIGIDLSLFNGKVDLVADYYEKTTDDLLLNVQIPATSGFTSSLQNVGSVENKGFEFLMDANIIDGEFKFDFGFNVARNVNEVTSLGDEQESFITNGWNILKGQPASVLQVGKPIGQFYGYVTDGLFLNDAEAAAAPDQTAADGSSGQLGGNTRFADTNGDGAVDQDDRTVIGNALPDFTGGFSTKFSYKNLELSTAWAFSKGNEILNLQRLEGSFAIGRYVSRAEFANRWSYLNTDEQNRNASTHTVLDGKNLFTVLDTYVEDGSFLRMRDVTLSYRLNADRLNLKGLSSVRFYISGQNLITFTKYTGFDPEVNVAGQDNLLLGYDYSAYPSAKIYSIGANITF